MKTIVPILLSLFSFGASAQTKDQPTLADLPKIKSAAAFVVDLNTGEVLFEREADIVRPIASISKVMGAIVIHKYCNLKPEDLHTMSVENRDAAKGGDKTRLTTGWAYSHHDLMKAALMRSDNRALPALGQACGMDTVKFGEKMTEEAKLLGLKNTSFKEPNGLNKENVSTPREIMVFLKEAIKIEEIREIMSTKESTIVGHRDNRTRSVEIRNTDRLLSKDLATILGGKTGYTDIARYCLAIAAETDGKRQLGMVFLGAEGKHTRFADFTRVINWLLPSKAFAGETKSAAPSSSPAANQDKSLPAPSNAIIKQPDTPVGTSALKDGGASAKPEDLFEYYW
jgi:D-alanyl-D-alanine endopeptidase (penicillin-binding protein 7)